MYQLLEWDTQFFGFGIASISAEGFTFNYIEPLLTTLKIQGIKLAYCFIPPDDVEKNALALKYGGFLADEKTTFGKSLKPDSSKELNSSIKKYDGDITPELIELALQTSHHSRFRIDPNFPDGIADKMYAEWIKNSLNGKMADHVLVYSENDTIAGMLTLTCKKDKGVIGLLGVDSQSRGKGIGRELMKATEQLLVKQGIEQLEVVTQKANSVACVFYESSGFSVIHRVNVYHFWIDK